MEGKFTVGAYFSFLDVFRMFYIYIGYALVYRGFGT